MALRAFRPAHEHEWFNQYGTIHLKEFAESAQLSFNVVKHFSSSRIMDEDLVWLESYPDARMLANVGLTSGQALMLSQFAAQRVEEIVNEYNASSDAQQ